MGQPVVPELFCGVTKRHPVRLGTYSATSVPDLSNVLVAESNQILTAVLHNQLFLKSRACYFSQVRTNTQFIPLISGKCLMSRCLQVFGHVAYVG